MLGHLREQHPAAITFEPRDQADLLQVAAGSIPRQPQAVRVPQVRLAVGGSQLLGAEHVLAVWGAVAAAIFVVGIHGHRACHAHRLVGIAREEHDAPAEAANARLPDGVKDRVGPDGGESIGVGADLILVGPGNALLQVELGAARSGDCQHRQAARAEKPPRRQAPCAALDQGALHQGTPAG